jgi:hypothetical protein
VNLSAAFPDNNIKNAVFAETIIRAEAAGVRKAYVTYTDRFQLWCNGQPIFEGRPRGWFDPDREKLGNARLVPDQFEIELPLKAGENTIRVRSEVTEPFGWGFWIRVTFP